MNLGAVWRSAVNLTPPHPWGWVAWFWPSLILLLIPSLRVGIHEEQLSLWLFLSASHRHTFPSQTISVWVLRKYCPCPLPRNLLYALRHGVNQENVISSLSGLIEKGRDLANYHNGQSQSNLLYIWLWEVVRDTFRDTQLSLPIWKPSQTLLAWLSPQPGVGPQCGKRPWATQINHMWRRRC